MFSVVGCKKDDTTPEDTTMDLTAEPDATVDDATTSVDVSQLAKDYFTNMPEDSYKIGQQDFVDKVIAGDDMVILDIRAADAYAEGHVQGAINMPWGPTFSADLNKVPQDKDVFIYCYTGQTAGQTVALLNVAGINAKSVNLGWNLGISLVEGVDQVTETVENTFGDDTYTVSADVQKALDDYYAGLGTIEDERFKNYKVSEADLAGMINNGEDFYLLSIRKADAFDAMHIEGANNVPFGSTLVDNLGDVPMDKKVVVYCYTGQTAGQTVAIMRLLGYDAVSLNGGMGMAANAPSGWTNKGYPVVSTSSVYNAVVSYFSDMPDNSYKIGQQDFVDKVVAGDDMVILDIRAADAYAEGHIQGAISMPWGTAISENLSKIPQDKEVFIYCYTGQTAGQAVVTLNVAGINARSVNLGWNLGISLVEGVADVTTTDATEFGEDTYTIDPEIQAAIDAYYVGLADVADTQFKNYKVSEDDLKAMIDNEDSFTLISARKADAYAEGHIQGAINVPFGSSYIDGLAGLAKNSTFVVYCYTGQTAGQAVAGMRLLGYNAVSLNGGAGMESNAPYGWTNKGYELVTE